MSQEHESPQLPLAYAREQMLGRVRNITTNPYILEAFKTIERDMFTPDDVPNPYELQPIPLSSESSVSSPEVQAMLMDAVTLNGQGRVLEVGTALGYGAALLSQCAEEVVTVEYNDQLSSDARMRFDNGYHDFSNIHPVAGDGAKGYEDKAPYDHIIVTAGAREIPQALVKQLAIGGRIVVPVGKDYPFRQKLAVGVMTDEGFRLESVKQDVSFVPLVSDAHGAWRRDEINQRIGFDFAYLASTGVPLGDNMTMSSQRHAVIVDLKKKRYGNA